MLFVAEILSCASKKKKKMLLLHGYYKWRIIFWL